jgi:hypothetical protein
LDFLGKTIFQNFFRGKFPDILVGKFSAEKMYEKWSPGWTRLERFSGNLRHDRSATSLAQDTARSGRTMPANAKKLNNFLICGQCLYLSLLHTKKCILSPEYTKALLRLP